MSRAGCRYAGLALATGILCLPMLVYPLGRGQAFYAYAGWMLREGGVPGLEWWQQTPPGTASLYALVELALGLTPLAVRVLDLLWSVATALAVAAFAARAELRCGWLAGLAWSWSYAANYDYWHSAQVDGFVTLPSLAVLWLADRACQESRPSA